MPKLINDPNIHFEAKEVSATFDDGSEIHFMSDHDIHATKNSKTGEDVLVFHQTNHGGDPTYEIRLYLTTPDSDWRTDATDYSWKLSLASMLTTTPHNNGSHSNNNETSTEWLYWNRENNIDSQIQVLKDSNSSSYTLFHATSMVLHFTPESTRGSSSSSPKTKLRISDILLGAYHLPPSNHSQDNDPPTKLVLYEPCPDFGFSNKVCEITDGIVSDSSDATVPVPVVVPAATAMLPDGISIYAAVAALAVAFFLVVWGGLRCRRRHLLAQQYAPIADGHNDLEMEEG